MSIVGAGLAGDSLTLVILAACLAGIVLVAYAIVRLSGPRPTRAPGRTRAGGSSVGSARRGGSLEWRPNGNGKAPGATLRFKGDESSGYALGREPTIIGSSDDLCTIVLPGDGIAPEHARIWFRQGKFLLHHVGGLSRKTFVSGQEADWVVLEFGDEVTIGPHRLVFEDRQSEEEPVAEAVPGPREQGMDDDIARMEAAVRELWAEALPASETAVGERSGTGKYKVHRRKDELARRVGGQWVKRGRTVVLER